MTIKNSRTVVPLANPGRSRGCAVEPRFDGGGNAIYLPVHSSDAVGDAASTSVTSACNTTPRGTSTTTGEPRYEPPLGFCDWQPHTEARQAPDVISSGDSRDAVGQRLEQVASDTQDLLARMLGLLPCDDVAACHRLLNDVKALEDGLVARARAAGATNREIGRALGVSEAAARKRLRTYGHAGELVPELGLRRQHLA